MSDPHFSSTALLVRFDGADGATSAADESPSGHSISFAGNAQLDTDQFKWGTASLLCDGSGDYGTAADHADWSLGISPFTVEGFIRLAGLNTGERGACLASHYSNSGNQRSWGLYYNNDGGPHQLSFIRSSNGSATTTLSGSWPGGAPALDTWYHVAADRDALQILRIYVDGVVVASEDIGSFAFHDSTDGLSIGRLNSSSGFRRFLNGWLDALRLTRGVGRYGGDFNPPQGPYSAYKALGVARPGRPATIGVALPAVS